MTSLEERIREIWRRVLEIDESTPDEDFFDLGGDSLLAAQMMAEINALTNEHITIRTFFEDPRLETLLRATRSP